MDCPSCTVDIPDDARFCAYCGMPLRRCPSCGQAYGSDAEFCGACGTRLAAESDRSRGPGGLLAGADALIPGEDQKWLTRDRKDIFGFLYRPNFPERRHFLPAGDNTLGAGEKNDIVIEQPAVSWNHALVICRDGRVLIQDSASTNGTFVNDVHLTRPRRLSHGDTVKFGNVEFRVWLKPQLRDNH